MHSFTTVLEGEDKMMRSSMSQVDTHPTPPPPGRIQKSKHMDYWENADESKAEGDVDDHLRNLKQKRVFGTHRNTNVVVKTKTEKKSTPKYQVETAPKSMEKRDTESVNHEVLRKDGVPRDEEAEKDADGKVEPEVIEKADGSKEAKMKNKEDSNPVEETEMKPKKKKSVGFQEKLDIVDEASAQRTPVQLSSSLRKPRRSGTPYHTAQNCRRCKIDKLESSSYWIEQIKLAESVGKHFVSAAFFHLARECNAEPIRSLKMELKRYLSRHGDLGNQNEWIETLRNYGLPVPKDDNNDKSIGDTMHSGNLLKQEDEPNCNHDPKSPKTE